MNIKSRVIFILPFLVNFTPVIQGWFGRGFPSPYRWVQWNGYWYQIPYRYLPHTVPKIPQKPICNCAAFTACMVAERLIETTCMAIPCSLVLTPIVNPQPPQAIPVRIAAILACLLAEEAAHVALLACVGPMSFTTRCSGGVNAGINETIAETLTTKAPPKTTSEAPNRKKRLANCPGGNCGCSCEQFNCHACHMRNTNLGCIDYNYSIMFGNITTPCKEDTSQGKDLFWNTMQAYWACVKACVELVDPDLPAKLTGCCGDKSNYGNMYDKYEYSCAKKLDCQLTYRSGCGVPLAWQTCKQTVGRAMSWRNFCNCYSPNLINTIKLNCNTDEWPCEFVVNWLDRGNWIWL